MSQDSAQVERAALETDREPNPMLGVLRTSVGRNLGLVVALALLCVVGVITAGDRFASTDNALTILKLAATIGVVSIGMTFVIIGGGIDLSVGAIVALSSVWATTLATQAMAEDIHWIVMVFTAVVAEAAADDLDEHRVLDLIMEGTPHPGAAATAMQHEGDMA